MSARFRGSSSTSPWSSRSSICLMFWNVQEKPLPSFREWNRIDISSGSSEANGSGARLFLTPSVATWLTVPTSCR